MLLTLKSKKQKDYSDTPQTLGEHLKKRRRELGLLQREAGDRMGVGAETVANWEKGERKPIPSQFQPVVAFLDYDPTPTPTTLAERVEAKRRSLGTNLDQVAQHLGWDDGSLRRYLKRTWRPSAERAATLEQFLELSGNETTAVVATPNHRLASGDFRAPSGLVALLGFYLPPSSDLGGKFVGG